MPLVSRRRFFCFALTSIFPDASGAVFDVQVIRATRVQHSQRGIAGPRDYALHINEKARTFRAALSSQSWAFSEHIHIPKDTAESFPANGSDTRIIAEPVGDLERIV